MSAAAKSEENYRYDVEAPIAKREYREVVAKAVPSATGFDVYDRKKKLVGHELQIEDARCLQREGEAGRYLVRTCDGVLLGKPTMRFDPGSLLDERKRNRNREGQ
jgi:hypothetical protein